MKRTKYVTKIRYAISVPNASTVYGTLTVYRVLDEKTAKALLRRKYPDSTSITIAELTTMHMEFELSDETFYNLATKKEID